MITLFVKQVILFQWMVKSLKALPLLMKSAITGESAPVIREAGGDKSSVTGGTKVLCDRIIVKVTTAPGETFLDKMIALVEGAIQAKNTQ